MRYSGCALVSSGLGPILSSQCLCLQSVVMQRTDLINENKSIKTHIPYGGVQTRKTETVHKKKKKNPGQGVKEEEWGMEDGQICREERKCC